MPTRFNYRITIEYDGTRYHGWQSQNNAIGIQNLIEKSIQKLTGKKIRVTGSGRTDAGVHARGQVANFHLSNPWAEYKLLKGLNAHLPEDIVISEVKEVPSEFNARFDAKRRIYQYFILDRETAIHRNFCWQVFYKLDKVNLFKLGPVLQGLHDFSSFSRLETQTESKMCEVFESTWRQESDFLIYRIEANRFLHGMVRTIVGTMVDTARGRFKEGQFEQIFRARDRNLAGQTAPAQGLFLEEVIYE
jgi:tRNA pseudouridine38-40 synthase